MKKNGIYLHERWISFSEICTNMLVIYAQGDGNSEQGPSDNDCHDKPGLQQLPSGLTPLPPRPFTPPSHFKEAPERRVDEKGPPAQYTGLWGEDRSRSFLPSYCRHTCRHLVLLLVCLAPTFPQHGHARKPGGRTLMHFSVFTVLHKEYKIPFGKT